MVSIYAPCSNHRADQLRFLNYLIEKLENIDLPLLIGGDANVYFSDLDYKGKSLTKHNIYRNKWLEFLNFRGLCDIWRALNIDKIDFTWRDNTKSGLVQERIDFIFCSESIFHLFKTL